MLPPEFFCITIWFFVGMLQIEESLTDAETKLSEAKKQYDQMLENKQLELSRHLKEISQKNDQVKTSITIFHIFGKFLSLCFLNLM